MPGTDEDIIRGLMHRCTDDVHARASIAAQVVTRQRRRDRRGRAVSLAARRPRSAPLRGWWRCVPRQAPPRPAPGARPAITLTAAQRALYRLSSAAASAPQGQGRYVVMREIQDNYKKMSVIDAVTGDVWTYQEGAGIPAELPVARHGSWAQAQYDAMPTAPAALRAVLISQYDQQQKQADGAMAGQRKQKDKILGRAHLPAIRPLELTADDKVVAQANLLLWNPLVPPALRSAVFKVLAVTPGVRVNSHARDDLGRPAVKISWSMRSRVTPRRRSRTRPRRGCSSRRTPSRPPAPAGAAATPTVTCTCPSPGPAPSRPTPDRYARRRRGSRRRAHRSRGRARRWGSGRGAAHACASGVMTRPAPPRRPGRGGPRAAPRPGRWRSPPRRARPGPRR